MNWFLWGCTIFAQFAAHAWSSRARNSGSIMWAALAGFFSHGVWFLAQLFIVNIFFVVKETGDWNMIATASLFYTVCAVAGQSLAQFLLLRFFETGKRQVGAR